MFDWFDKTFRRGEYPKDNRSDMEKIGDDMNKVIKFPELKMPAPPAPEVEQPAKVFYRLGLTDNNRVAFSMGYAEINMSKRGVQDLIDQLEFYRDRLEEDE